MSRMSANSPSVRLKLATTKRLRKKLTHVQICDLIIFNPFYAEVEGRIWPSRPERAFLIFPLFQKTRNFATEI